MRKFKVGVVDSEGNPVLETNSNLLERAERLNRGIIELVWKTPFDNVPVVLLTTQIGDNDKVDEGPHAKWADCASVVYVDKQRLRFVTKNQGGVSKRWCHFLALDPTE